MKLKHSSSKFSLFVIILFVLILVFTLFFLHQSHSALVKDVTKGGNPSNNKHNPFGDENKDNDDPNNQFNGFGEDVKVGAEIGNSIYDQKTRYAREICERAFPAKIFRNVLNSAARAPKRIRSGADNNNNHAYRELHRNSRRPVSDADVKQNVAAKNKNGDDAIAHGNSDVDPALRRRKAIYFIGDSHALRTFRWTAMFLELTKYLQPASSEYVNEKLIFNFDLGVFHDAPKTKVELIPNPSRLESIEFRRAAFVSDVVHVLNDITHSEVRKEKNFEAFVFISVGAWDILRPTIENNGFTLDSLFGDLMKSRQGKKRDDEAANKNNANDNNNNNNNLFFNDEESSEVLEKFMKNWKQSCEHLNIALVNDFGWGESNDEDHHVRRQMTNSGLFSRVTWRWPGAPNCSALRFQSPKASPALQAACPMVSDSWWPSFQAAAKELVRPMEKRPLAGTQEHQDVLNDPIFEMIQNDGSHSRRTAECQDKVDGVHPSHLCVAREAGAYLLRVLS